MNDQCGFQSAPCSIQRTSIAFSNSFSERCESGAGIITFGSVLVMRRTSSLFAGAAGDDGAVAGGELAERDVLDVEAEAGLALPLVGSVALEAAVREDRLDVEVEVDAIGHAGDRGRGGPAARQRPDADRGAQHGAAPQGSGPPR